ncbi:hypothetical protein D3C85_1832960 [compost metagenome]
MFGSEPKRMGWIGLAISARNSAMLSTQPRLKRSAASIASKEVASPPKKWRS